VRLLSGQARARRQRIPTLDGGRMTYRILVTGSRTWTDWQQVRDALHRAYLEGAMNDPHGQVILMTGACPTGADKIAEDTWLKNVGPDSIERHPADWDTYGKGAGFVRNTGMVDQQPDVVLAFLDWCRMPCGNREPHRSHGANHCANYAEKSGIEVRRFYP
jgi:hypothetical protein